MLLSLLPVAKEIDSTGVIVDSKSGVSGAGRTPSSKTHFCEVSEDFKAYSEIGHRHTAEMAQELSLAAGARSLSRSPLICCLWTGASSAPCIFGPLRAWSVPTLGSALFKDFYKDEPFVEVCDHVPSLAEVVGTNYCRIAVREDAAAGLVKVFAVIDNLVKGASGQAVQNMNCMFGLSEETGLGRKV